MTEQHSGNPYEPVRDYLKAASDHLHAAGRSARELGEFALDKFGRPIIPYLARFQSEVHEGAIKVGGLADSARATILGLHVSPAEREHMIREAAYFHAEKRGRAQGADWADWFEAEKEIDAVLAEQAGLLGRGREVLASAASVAEQEISSVRETVSAWLESKRHGDHTAEQG